MQISIIKTLLNWFEFSEALPTTHSRHWWTMRSTLCKKIKFYLNPNHNWIETLSSVYPLPYQFGNEHPVRRSSHLPTGAVFVPKNVAPSMKLIHRPATPVSNCLYGKTGTLCQDLSSLSVNDDQKQWEDLFSNVQLTEYWENYSLIYTLRQKYDKKVVKQIFEKYFINCLYLLRDFI